MKEINQEKIAPRVAVVGAGPAGIVAALKLQAQGYAVTVLEKRGAPKQDDLGGGRSVNLALSHRGVEAMKDSDVGIWSAIEQITVPMRGRVLHLLETAGDANDSGITEPQTIIQDNHSYGKPLLSVHRGRLWQRMIAAAQDRGIEIRFDQTISTIDLGSGAITTGTGDQTDTQTFDLIIGADGSGSVVREFIDQALPDNEKSKRVAFPVVYREFQIAANNGGGYQLATPEGLHIWPHGQHMAIALPNNDNSFTGTIFVPVDMRDKLNTKEDFMVFIQKFYPSLLTYVPDLEAQFEAGKWSEIHKVATGQWYSGKGIIVGDAAHAMPPFFGLGLNTALETVIKLCTKLGRVDDFNHGQLEATFADFQKERKPDADAMIQASVYNFQEMAELSKDPIFQACRKLEKLFYGLINEEVPDLHDLMSFTSRSQREIWEFDRMKEEVLNAFINEHQCQEALLNNQFTLNTEQINDLKAKLNIST